MNTNKRLFINRLAEVLKTLLGLSDSNKEKKLTLQPDYVKK